MSYNNLAHSLNLGLESQQFKQINTQLAYNFPAFNKRGKGSDIRYLQINLAYATEKLVHAPETCLLAEKKT